MQVHEGEASGGNGACMRVMCGESEVEALVDTGASVSVVTRELVREKGWREEVSRVTALGGLSHGKGKLAVVSEVRFGVKFVEGRGLGGVQESQSTPMELWRRNSIGICMFIGY